MKDINIDVFLSPDCDPRSRIAFSGSKAPDANLRRKAQRIAKAVDAGQFEAVKASWTDEEVREAQGYVPGVDETPDGLRYRLIPAYIRVAEVVGEAGRSGAHDALADILGDGSGSTSDDPFG